MADFSAPLTRYLWQTSRSPAGSQVYAVLDAARDPQIYRTLSDAGQQYECLYEGALSAVMARVAPYLVPLQEFFNLSQWILRSGWGNSWGILLKSQAGPDEIRKHLRKFMIVQTEDRTKLYFRYYDPRVLRVYLPTCNEHELKEFFGPIDSFYVESEAPGELIEFRRTGSTLVRNVIRLLDVEQGERSDSQVERFLRYR